jgi:hypothetical protein
MMMRNFGAGAAALAGGLLLLGATPAAAGEVFAGLFAHDVDLGVAICCYESGADFQIGVRSAPFAHLLGGEVRAHALGSINTRGGTDFAAAGLSLRTPVMGRFYVQPGLGIAVQNGPTAQAQLTNDRIYFGSAVLFEPELSLGWRLSDDLAAEASWVHLSHAQLAGRQNPGMDDVGVRLVYRFGGR